MSETNEVKDETGTDDPQAIHAMCEELGLLNRDIGIDGISETPSKDAESVEPAINSLMMQFCTEWNPFGQSRFGSEHHLESEGLEPEDAHPVLHHGVLAGVLLKQDHVYYLASPPPPFPPEEGEGEGDADGEAEADENGESGEADSEDGEGEGVGESEDSEGGDSESGDSEGGEGSESESEDGSEGDGEGDGESGEGSEGEGDGEGSEGDGDSGEGEGSGESGGEGTGDFMGDEAGQSFKEWLAEQSQAIKDSFGDEGGETGSPSANYNAFGGDESHNTGGIGEHSLDAQGEGREGDMTGQDEHHRRKGSASDFMRKAMKGKRFKDTFGDYESEME